MLKIKQKPIPSVKSDAITVRKGPTYISLDHIIPWDLLQPSGKNTTVHNLSCRYARTTVLSTDLLKIVQF